MSADPDEPSGPYEPPYCTGELPGTGGAIGSEPEDFRVDELPAYAPSGSGEHRYVLVEKRLMTTPELVKLIARAADVDAREIGYAGLKDKHAVTTQWLSLPNKSRATSEWALPEGVRVLESSLHANKLRTGHLTGNRFEITLTGVGPHAFENARAIGARIERSGLPNYFGAQRFGRDNLLEALSFLREGGRRRLNGFLLKLYPSVVQSEVFNRYLALRSGDGLDRLLAGEIVRLEGSGATFLVEDLARETPRFERREIHPTGPILGPKMRPARGRPLELEAEAARLTGVDDAMLSTLARFAPGTRRDLRVYPQNLEISTVGGGDGAGPERLRLAFELPAGSYATVLVRELTRGLAPLRQAE